jgi:hypothetical protein
MAWQKWGSKQALEKRSDQVRLVACRIFDIFISLFVIFSLKADQPKQQK